MTGTDSTRGQNKQRAVSFTRPDQIAKILSEVSRLKIEVLIRYSNTGKAVRGIAEHFSPTESTLRVSGISSAGDELLKDYDRVRIEFVLLSTKLVFESQIRARAIGKVVLAAPAQLLSVERRRNARFKVPASHAAFVEFTEQKLDIMRFDAPFVPLFMMEERFLVPKLRIDDISLGGVACFTRYTAVARDLKPSEIGLNANVHFPGMQPISVPMTIRWMKKTVSALQNGQMPEIQRVFSRFKGPNNEEPQMKETYYRVGLQFSEVSQDLDAALRTYIHSVQTAESV